MESDEAKWRICTILKLNREQSPPKWLTSKELSFYTGISRQSLRALISRWFRYKWAYIQRQEIEFGCYGYYIGSRGLTFLISAPRFLDVPKFESRLVEYQMSAGIIERPVKQTIPAEPVEAIEMPVETVIIPEESLKTEIEQGKSVKCTGCGLEFHAEGLKDGFCYDCTQIVIAEKPVKADKQGFYHCKRCGRGFYLEQMNFKTGYCFKCEAEMAVK